MIDSGKMRNPKNPRNPHLRRNKKGLDRVEHKHLPQEVNIMADQADRLTRAELFGKIKDLLHNIEQNATRLTKAQEWTTALETIRGNIPEKDLGVLVDKDLQNRYKAIDESFETWLTANPPATNPTPATPTPTPTAAVQATAQATPTPPQPLWLAILGVPAVRTALVIAGILLILWVAIAPLFNGIMGVQHQARKPKAEIVEGELRGTHVSGKIRLSFPEGTNLDSMRPYVKGYSDNLMTCLGRDETMEEGRLRHDTAFANKCEDNRSAEAKLGLEVARDAGVSGMSVIHNSLPYPVTITGLEKQISLPPNGGERKILLAAGITRQLTAQIFTPQGVKRLRWNMTPLNYCVEHRCQDGTLIRGVGTWDLDNQDLANAS